MVGEPKTSVQRARAASSSGRLQTSAAAQVSRSGPNRPLRSVNAVGRWGPGTVYGQDVRPRVQERFHPHRSQFAQGAGDHGDLPLEVEGVHPAYFFRGPEPLRASKLKASSALSATRVVRPMTLSIS